MDTDKVIAAQIKTALLEMTMPVQMISGENNIDPKTMKAFSEYCEERDPFKEAKGGLIPVDIEGLDEYKAMKINQLTKKQEEAISVLSEEIQDDIREVNRLGNKLSQGLEKYRKPAGFEQMKAELIERQLRANEIKDVLYTASQETGQYLTREQIIDAISEIINK